MTIKIHYNEEDDVFTIYDNEYKPSETIEFSEFLNIDINKDKGIVGFEVFYASEFFSALNEIITKNFLKTIDDVSVNCKNYRNNWFVELNFKTSKEEIKVPLPPLRKSDYTSPLIASCR
jgi:uncharacterized protein YuzE